MINEYIFFAQQVGSDKETEIKRVYCNTGAQAWEKAKFLYPNTYFLIRTEQGRTFKNFDEFLEHRNDFKKSI